jgi:hypothetical protein
MVSTLKELDREGLQALLVARGWQRIKAAEAGEQVVVWFERGDVALVYENLDLSSPEVGAFKLVSYGGPAAQLEFEQYPTYPVTLPDIGQQINWRYQLHAVYRGERDDIVTEFLKQGEISIEGDDDES